jgi:hypothetical protein
VVGVSVGAGAVRAGVLSTGGAATGAGVGLGVVALGVAFGGAARAAVRGCCDPMLSEGGRTGTVCGRADVGAAVTSAGRVTVPLRVKFWSSLGPMASVAGVLLVGGGADVCAAWANATAGESNSPAVEAAIAKRQAPVIPSPLLS